VDVIADDLVHALLREQRSERADLTAAARKAAADDEFWRLCDESAVRVPRAEFLSGCIVRNS
jgi:hypothetical protein